VSLAPSARSAAVSERSARRGLEIGFGQDEHVGDLHDARLEELKHITRGRLKHDHHRVGHIGDLGLGLPHPDRLDHNDVKCGCQRRGRSAGGWSQAPEPVAGGARADEHGFVARIRLDADAIAQQRASGPPRTRIDGEHGDRPASAAPFGDQAAQQRGLADAGRPGHPDHVSGRLGAEGGRGDLGQQLLSRPPRVRRAALD
jgi:hypothetical protein